MKENKLIVVKFGGSSLADANQFKKVKDIILSDSSRHYVVASAPGKRFSGDTKVTDMLYKCYELSSRHESFSEVFNDVKKRYDEIIEGLGLNLTLNAEYDEIESALRHTIGKDYAASRGEYLNSKILAAYLGFDFIDAYGMIYFREDGSFDAERTNDLLSAELKKHDYAVVPGFYGTMPNDTVKTFSRGGSDVTGSIVAKAADATLYENWTDVSGFLVADPRIVSNPRPIDVITYKELRELSYMGATVLHEDAIFPVRACGIPINIRNTNKPEDPGTMIVAEATNANNNIVTGISGKHGFSVITIEKDQMNKALGFVRRVLSVFESCRLSIEHIPSGVDTMSVVVESAALSKCKELLIDNICSAVEPDSIFVEEDISLIAVVGRGMISAKGTAARVLSAVASANVNVKMIDQGSDELNIILGVNKDDFEPAIKAIYSEFER